MPKYPYDEIGMSLNREMIQGINKNFDDVESDLKRYVEPMEAIIGGAFNEAALTSNFRQRLDEEIEELQPNWTEFKQDTLARITSANADIDALETDKTSKGYVDNSLQNIRNEFSQTDRAFGATYATLAALRTANPDHLKRYVVSADNSWYYWGTSDWLLGGALSTAVIGDRAILPRQMSTFIQNEDNLIKPLDFTTGYVDGTGAIVATGSSRVSKTLVNINPNSVYRIQSSVPLTNTTIYVVTYLNGVFRTRYLFTNSENMTIPTGPNDQQYRISCIGGDEFKLYMHEGAEILPFEEPLILNPAFVKEVKPEAQTGQTDFVETVRRHNNSSKAMKAQVIGDRVFWVYQPIAEGKWVGHNFVKNSNDDFIVYSSAVIGHFENNVFVPEQYVMAGSNKELAFRVRPAGATSDLRWFPEHEGVGTAFSSGQSIKFDDVEKKGIMVTGALTDVFNVTLSQNINLVYPGSTEPLATLKLITTINSEGVSYTGNIKWLKTVEIERGYIGMLPTVIPPFDTLRDNLGTDYNATLGSGTTILNESNSLAFVKVNGQEPNTSYVLAQTIHNPESSLRKGLSGRREPSPLWLEHRDAATQKVYPQIYQNHTTVVGEVFKFGATIYTGLLHEAGFLLF